MALTTGGGGVGVGAAAPGPQPASKKAKAPATPRATAIPRARVRLRCRRARSEWTGRRNLRMRDMGRVIFLVSHSVGKAQRLCSLRGRSGESGSSESAGLLTPGEGLRKVLPSTAACCYLERDFVPLV